MSHATTDLPNRHRLTVEDYYRMAEVGILAPDARVELIEGEIIDMAPPGSVHSAIVNRLTMLLAVAAHGRAVLVAQNPVRLDRYSQPQPDLALARARADFYAPRHPGPKDVLLVIEVADSSLRFDHNVKTPLYARHGVPELWLIDVKGRKLVRYREPQTAGYALVDEPDLSVPLAVSRLPEVALDLRELFAYGD